MTKSKVFIVSFGLSALLLVGVVIQFDRDEPSQPVDTVAVSGNKSADTDRPVSAIEASISSQSREETAAAPEGSNDGQYFQRLLDQSEGNPERIVSASSGLSVREARHIAQAYFVDFQNSLLATGEGLKNDITYRHAIKGLESVSTGVAELIRLECGPNICAAAFKAESTEPLIQLTRELAFGDGPRVYAVFSEDQDRDYFTERRLIFSVNEDINTLGGSMDSLTAVGNPPG